MSISIPALCLTCNITDLVLNHKKIRQRWLLDIAPWIISVIFNKKILVVAKTGGNIGLFITLVPKVL